VGLADDQPRHGVRPAIDTTFESVADAVPSGDDLVAVVLTGMGRDGCSGAGAVARAGGTVLVQDEASAVVDGMPGAVAEAGHADAVLPTDRLVPRAVDAVTEKGEVEL
jgi:two-component system chemotaxis response regulator CheB